MRTIPTFDQIIVNGAAVQMTSSTRRRIEIPEGKPVPQRLVLEHATSAADAAEEAERRAA